MILVRKKFSLQLIREKLIPQRSKFSSNHDPTLIENEGTILQIINIDELKTKFEVTRMEALSQPSTALEEIFGPLPNSGKDNDRACKNPRRKTPSPGSRRFQPRRILPHEKRQQKSNHRNTEQDLSDRLHHRILDMEKIEQLRGLTKLGLIEERTNPRFAVDEDDRSVRVWKERCPISRVESDRHASAGGGVEGEEGFEAVLFENILHFEAILIPTSQL